LEPTTQEFVDMQRSTARSHCAAQSPAEARAALLELQSRPVGKPDLPIRDMILPTGPAASVRVRFIRPRTEMYPLPVIVYFHGGGWVAGDPTTHDRLTREIAAGTGACVIVVNFSRSPESPRSVTIEEAYAATRYIADNAARFDLDGSRLAIAGDDSGGTISLTVALLAKERRGPRIQLLVLFYPLLSSPPDTDIADAITADLIGASRDRLAGLPDTVIFTAEGDRFTQECEDFARRLIRAGVRITCARYLGTIHDFVMLNALADTPATRAVIAHANAALKTALA
jgi:acetyl esterase